jgi:hypothetical protein
LDRQHLDARILLLHAADEAFLALAPGLRAGGDADVPHDALAADELTEDVGGGLGGSDVVRGDVGVGLLGIDAGVQGHDRHPAGDRLLHRRDQRLRVGGGDHYPGHPARNHVVDEVDLAGDVGLGGGALVEYLLVAEFRSCLLGALPDSQPEGGVRRLGNPDQCAVRILRVLRRGAGRQRPGQAGQHGRDRQCRAVLHQPVLSHTTSRCDAPRSIETDLAYLPRPLRTWSAKTARMMITPMMTCCQKA